MTTGTTPHHDSERVLRKFLGPSRQTTLQPPIRMRFIRVLDENMVMGYYPLILHLLSTLILTIVIRTSVDGQDFNLQSWKALARFTPLQSDITTAVSAGIAIVRSFAAMWSASVVWRCIFILMESGGISLEQIDRLITWQVHLYPHLKSSQRMAYSFYSLPFPANYRDPFLQGRLRGLRHIALQGSGRLWA